MGRRKENQARTEESLREAGEDRAVRCCAMVIALGLGSVVPGLLYQFWPTWPPLLCLLAFLLLTAAEAAGLFSYYRARRGGRIWEPRRWRAAVLLPALAAAALLLVGAWGMDRARPATAARWERARLEPIGSELSDAVIWDEFRIPYEDYYEWRIDAKASPEIRVSILDESGEPIWTTTGGIYLQAVARGRLKRGKYRVALYDFGGGWIDGYLDFD